MKIDGGPIRYAQDKALEQLLGCIPRIEDRSRARFFYSVGTWEKEENFDITELEQKVREFKAHPHNILVVEVSI
jgi:hypothetical protein